MKKMEEIAMKDINITSVENKKEEQAVTRDRGVRPVKSKRFCRKCGGNMVYSAELDAWVCENGCSQ
jgi:hypothetical protein